MSVPLGGIAGVFALSSAVMVGASKKIESKISKHQETVTLAVAKRDTVERQLNVTCAQRPEGLGR